MKLRKVKTVMALGTLIQKESQKYDFPIKKKPFYPWEKSPCL